MAGLTFFAVVTVAFFGAMAASIWETARNPAFTWGFALRGLAVGSALVLAGVASAVVAAWLLLRGTGGAALDQALVLGLAVFFAAPLEGQRWLPRLERRRWYPSRLFRIAEAGLLALVLVLVLWGLLAPTHASLA